jgi:hypothetical protein
MASVAAIREAIRLLVAERQAQQARGAGRDKLESSQLELLRLRQELARELVAQCLRRSDGDAVEE